MAAKNERYFCIMAMPRVEERTKAALLDEFKWPVGTTIRARFLEGDPGLQERVERVAQEWFGPDMANMRLQFGNDSNADIRVSFVQGNGSWCYLGTVCQQIPGPEPTMNYGWLTPESRDDELRPVVLHEFGHALGLIHEHRNPDSPIDWNRAAVIADLSGPPNFWDQTIIENNIFKRYDAYDVFTTPTDRDSIMINPIPTSWTTNGFSIPLSTTLSETDREYIRGAYPW